MDEFNPCSLCSRTPLVGEEVTVFASADRESWVCEHCLDRPRTASLGDPVRRERVRTAAGAANVRRAWPSSATAESARVAAAS